MPALGHYIYTSHKINSKQAQNEDLVPSLSKEGCDQGGQLSQCATSRLPPCPVHGSEGWLVKRMDSEQAIYSICLLWENKSLQNKTTSTPKQKKKKKLQGVEYG